LLNSLK